MFDLKIIVFLVCFSVLFGGVMVMVGQEVNTQGEYISPTSGNVTYGEPSLGLFDTLSAGLGLDTGIWIIDNWFVSITLPIVAFLIVRVIRGQG